MVKELKILKKAVLSTLMYIGIFILMLFVHDMLVGIL